MTVKIDPQICNGCHGAKEPLCIRICPGDLLRIHEGKAAIREPGECWDCAACIKSCPRQAIAMYLPTQLGGKGASLTAKVTRGTILWTCRRPDGREEVIEIERERVI